MGKQSTGKSYMLNHLFGTKFDISGGRCTDGSWLSARIVDDILYVVCDFEGLGSFERSPQEDMLLATFNAAIRNCTIFKCDNRFDRTIEDMFNRFQQGVGIMKGSEGCFQGQLMLIIKDVVETGADAAVEDFNRHIERLVQEAELVINDNGEKESTFFSYRMYQKGMALIPYPPLANAAFFRDLNETIEPTIVEIQPSDVYDTGTKFLNHIKMLMAKLHIGDFAPMSGEYAKMRAEEIRNNLQNAVEAGATQQNAKDGATFKVEEDANLLILDGNTVIKVTAKEAKERAEKEEKSDSLLDDQIEAKLLKLVEDINDGGLILGRPESLRFLWDHFSARIQDRTHSDFKATTDLFQLFLDVIYWRRYLRVTAFIEENTKKFGKKEKEEVAVLKSSADSKFVTIRAKLQICKSKCKECFYPCLLCRNHDGLPGWNAEHSCFQDAGKHICVDFCSHCAKDGRKSVKCGEPCGHPGTHNCRDDNTPHTCGETCDLNQFAGCQTKCNLEPGHDKTTQPCRCSAETHYCVEKCVLDKCSNTCKYAYNVDHDRHICTRTDCPYPCQVKCATDDGSNQCPYPCHSSNGHDHHLTVKEGEEAHHHHCGREHDCPQECEEKGVCYVEIEQVNVKKETFTNAAGTKFEYDSFAQNNAMTKKCSLKIPKDAFQHTGAHKCDNDKKGRTHYCDQTCDACGYFCKKAFKHDGLHAGQHGNMRNTKFYATDDTMDTGDGRSYMAGDQGIAEICNLYCERMGRGHIHLEFCKYHAKEEECVPDTGIRHQIRPYKPDPSRHKDEVQHSLYWKRKGWEDPCKGTKHQFNKCPFVCNHADHERKDNKDDGEDKRSYCTLDLWHPVKCDVEKGCTCGGCHTFTCKHSDTHVIFLGDCSGSMDSKCKNAPTTTFIKDYKLDSNYPQYASYCTLDNALGALYEAIHNFILFRTRKQIYDDTTVVMFESSAHIAVPRKKAHTDFVRDDLMTWKVQWGGTNFKAAFSKANELVNRTESTVLIFMTDGYDSDNGSSDIVRRLKNEMGDKFSLYCIVLGQNVDTTVVDGICKAGKGQMLKNIEDASLSSTFVNIAKKMGGGGFM